jgi:hypothetical protein
LLKTQQQARATIIAQAKERKRALWDNKALSRNQRSARLSFIALEQAKQLADLRDQQKKDYQTFTQSLNTTLPLIDFRKMESLVCGPSDSRPVGDIRNFTAHRAGREVEYRLKGSDIAAFVDKGRVITVLDRTDESVLAVLQLGTAKWGRELSLSGGDEFKTQAIRLAVAHGIYINNPELQDQITQEVTRLTNERKDLGIKILNMARIKKAGALNLRFAPEEPNSPQPVVNVPIEPPDKSATDFEDETDETLDQDRWVPDVPKF